MVNPREMDFFEHLDELRNRIIRCFIYVLAGMGAAWFLKVQIMDIIQSPLQQAIARAGLPQDMEVVVFGPSVMSGFSYAIQLALFGGLLFAFPLIALEAWLFVEPALYAHEKKYVYIVLPSSIILFGTGVMLCYSVAPLVFGFLLGFFQDLEIEPILDISKYIWLLMRLLLSFGIVFQLPLVITFLARIGLVTHTGLLSKWRHAVVVILVASAIITPTPDPINMSLLAGPVVGLYLLSILLAKIFGRPRETYDSAPEAPSPAPEPAPGKSSEDAGAEDESDDSATAADDSAEPDEVEPMQ
jgi:sec-independent protein translocase protein TatC